MMQTQPFEKHVWAEIDLEALRHNFRAVKARAGALPLCAVVKADSYGHGAVQCARVFAEEGAAWLADDAIGLDWKLTRMMNEPEHLPRLASRSLVLGKPNAANVVLERVLDVSV